MQLQNGNIINKIIRWRPIREDQPKDVEKFADLLDIAVTNLKEAKRTEELGNGTLYHKLQRKMPERMLSRYKRWVYEQRKNEDDLLLKKLSSRLQRQKQSMVFKRTRLLDIQIVARTLGPTVIN